MMGLFLFIIMAGSFVNAATFRAIVLGNGCQLSQKNEIELSISEGLVSVPISLDINFKKSRINRQICQSRIKLQPKKNEQILLIELLQMSDLDLKNGDEIKNQISVSNVGGVSEVVKKEYRGPIKESSKLSLITKSTSSLCGKETMIRIENTVIFDNKNEGRFTTKPLQMKVSIQKCP